MTAMLALTSVAVWSVIASRSAAGSALSVSVPQLSGVLKPPLAPPHSIWLRVSPSLSLTANEKP